MIDFDLIVAADEQGGIAKQGRLPWRLGEDLRHFKELTSQVAHGVSPNARNAIIMGRKTWESLPPTSRPLPGRLNVVLTASPDLALPGGVLLVASLPQGLRQLAQRHAAGQIAKVFVIGGAQVYAEAVRSARCRHLFLTRVQGSYDCDTFLPPLDESFVMVRTSPAREEGGVRFSFEVYERAKGA